MNINFFDDSDDKPRVREEVRILEMGVDVAPEGRRVALDFVLTPFIERPTLHITITNGTGQKAGSLTVIETLDTHFSVVVHLRDGAPTNPYIATATAYYANLEAGSRQTVHTHTETFTVQPNE